MPLHERIGAWLVDYGYVLRGYASMMAHREPPAHYLGHVVPERAPVILIPGILNTWAFMKRLGDRISFAGHPVYVIPELGYNIHDIPTSAQKLRSLIEKEGLSGVVLVAHSKGGLIGKYLLAHYDTDDRVSGMVAIAAPFSGSALAELVPHRALAELRADSEIVKDLEGHRAVNARIFSIIPEYDNHVWAERGSVLEGAAGNIDVPVSGHHKTLFSEPVSQAVLGAIENLKKR